MRDWLTATGFPVVPPASHTTPPAAPLTWGILGTGAIARVFAGALRQVGYAGTYGVASRDMSRVPDGDDFRGARLYDSYEAMLSDGTIDIVYVATPHAAHAEWGIKALDTGKHVLVEKPLATSATDGRRLVAAAERNNRFLAEAFMFRHNPVTHWLARRGGFAEIGGACLIEIAMGLGRVPDTSNRLFDKRLGGGAILDLGCYTVSLARLIAGIQTGTGFAEPETVSGAMFLGAGGVDEWSAATLRFQSGVIVQLRCSITVPQENSLRIWGKRGSISVRSPCLAGVEDEPSASICIERPGQRPASIDFGQVELPFVTQIRNVAVAVRGRRRELDWPAMGWADSIGNMSVLDAWRAAASDCAAQP